MKKNVQYNNYSQLLLLLISITVISIAKSNVLPPSITLRPVPVKNIEYSPDGKLLAVPNLITAGSVGVFTVSQESKIAKLPSRFSDKDFYRNAGVFYFATKKKNEPPLVFLSLPELLTGYTVTFVPNGNELAIAGGEKVFMYNTSDWKPVRIITVSTNTTRVVFSPDGSKMGVIADGGIYVFETDSYSIKTSIQPETSHKFADIAFSQDGTLIAALEYRTLVLDHGIRVRLFSSQNGDIDRALPYFPDKLSSPPGNHFPLISFTPRDSALVVSLEKSIGSKTLLIKSNDGEILREFKGAHHAFSYDMIQLAVGGVIYSTSDWKEVRKYTRSALCCAFSPTDRTIVTVSHEKMQRFKIEW